MPTGDPFGGKETSTEYQLSGRPKANKSRAKSVAGVVVTFLVLIFVLAALLLTKGTTTLAPVGSSGDRRVERAYCQKTLSRNPQCPA